MGSKNITFGEKLRNLRKKSGKTQMEVVEEIAILFSNTTSLSQANLSALEQRETSPRGEVLEVLATYFRVPISYFVHEVEHDEAKLEKARQYLDSIKNRRPLNGQIFLNTNQNKSGDEEVRNSLENNLSLWQPSFDDDDDYLEAD